MTKKRHDPTLQLAVKLWRDKVPWLKFIEDSPPDSTLAVNGDPITIETNRDTRKMAYSTSLVSRSVDSTGKHSAPTNKFILAACGTTSKGVPAICAPHDTHEIGHSTSSSLSNLANW